MSNNYEVNYDDERFAQVEADKQGALTELENTYSGMISESDKYYQAQIDASKDWADKQSQLQQEQTDFAIEQIGQQKDQAHKDYIKEQSGAYVDWQKQSNQYGAEAERQATAGLTGTGFSESSQVSMYNTYQNRVATAREAFSRAVLNYDNAIKDARLQNNAALAEIAANALQQQLELSLQGFQYKNNLILEQANKKTELNNTYYNRYLDVLNQINQENALAEDVRQFNETLEFNTTQAELDRQHQSKENELDRQHSSTEAQLNREFQAKQADLDREFQSKQNELNRQHDMAMQKAKTAAEKEMLALQHQYDMQKLAQQHANSKKLLEQEYALKQQQQKTIDKDEPTEKPLESAYDYLNKLISSGKSKSYVSQEINAALKAGEITNEEAAELRKVFTPRGYTY